MRKSNRDTVRDHHDHIGHIQHGCALCRGDPGTASKSIVAGFTQPNIVIMGTAGKKPEFISYLYI